VQMAKVDPPAPVIDAFRDVQRALADRERLRNEAEAYRNDILPRARGEAAQIKQGADAYRAEVIARALGDTARFLSVYNAYKQSEDVTLQRLYLETMEEILRNSKKIIIDKSAQGSPGVLPFLPLPDLVQSAPGSAQGSASQTPSASGSGSPIPPVSGSASSAGRRR
jgi:modulator of FtsH protease HflK